MPGVWSFLRVTPRVVVDGSTEPRNRDVKHINTKETDKFAAGQHHAVLRVHFVSLFELAFGLAFSGYVRHGDSCLTLQFTKLSTRDM